MTSIGLKAPLEGIRVLDFTSMIAGPYCTRLLADCGAEVIKVEPARGDHMRHTVPRRDERCSYFGYLNAGKKSLVLDLKSEGGYAQALKLLASTDIVVENFRPGVMSSLKLDYDRIAGEHPDLIFCSISGFGQTGPKALEPSYAPIVHALSGFDMAQMAYQPDLKKPEASGIFIADFLAGMFGFAGIQTALIHRLRHGGGQFIDVALLDCMFNILALESQLMQFHGSLKRNLFEPSRTKDGFITIAPVTQKNFEAIANAMGHPEWITDPRFVDIASRRDNWQAMYEAMEAWTLSRSARECEAHLIAAGVPCGRYRSIDEIMEDEQVAFRGSFFTAHDGSGPFRIPNVPYQFSNAAVHTPATVPDLGEHTEELLRSL